MYARNVKGKTLTLQVSGMLWQRSLVMRDLETKSLWSHLLGRAMDGELKGTSLKLIPAAMTTWKEWKQRHPKTTVLALTRTAERFDSRVWSNAARFVYGTTPLVTEKAIAVSLVSLQHKKIIQSRPGKQALLFTYSDNGKRVQSFDRNIDGKPMHFTPGANDTMTDRATSSTWRTSSGTCISGQLKGKKLKRIAGTISYLSAWEAFFPDSIMIK